MSVTCQKTAFLSDYLLLACNSILKVVFFEGNMVLLSRIPSGPAPQDFKNNVLPLHSEHVSKTKINIQLIVILPTPSFD